MKTATQHELSSTINKARLDSAIAKLKADKGESKDLSLYDPEFVTVIKEAKNRGNYTGIDPNDFGEV